MTGEEIRLHKDELVIARDTLRTLKGIESLLGKIERHVRPRVADAAPIRRPNLQEPAGGDYPVSSVPDLPPGIEPMTEDDETPWYLSLPGIPPERQ